VTVFDRIPVWGIFVGTMGIVLLALQAGAILGRRGALNPAASRGVRRHGRRHHESAAFMLGFTFNGASGRNDTRRQLVVRRRSHRQGGGGPVFSPSRGASEP
jgi:hypothetical protein